MSIAPSGQTTTAAPIAQAVWSLARAYLNANPSICLQFTSSPRDVRLARARVEIERWMRRAPKTMGMLGLYPASPELAAALVIAHCERRVNVFSVVDLQAVETAAVESLALRPELEQNFERGDSTALELVIAPSEPTKPRTSRVDPRKAIGVRALPSMPASSGSLDRSAARSPRAAGAANDGDNFPVWGYVALAAGLVAAGIAIIAIIAATGKKKGDTSRAELARMRQRERLDAMRERLDAMRVEQKQISEMFSLMQTGAGLAEPSASK